MTDTPYNKREMDLQFMEIKEILSRIETQTIRTNGRVNKLENWKSYIVGGLTILSAVVLPVLGFLAYQVITTSQALAALSK